MQVLSISKNHLRAIRYSLWSEITDHPQKQMKDLGINLIKAIPESIAECWICLTDYQGDLPDYITEISLESHDSYWQRWGIDIVE